MLIHVLVIFETAHNSITIFILDPNANDAQITFSGPQSITLITENINQPVQEETSHKNVQGGLPEEKLIFSTVEFVGNPELQVAIILNILYFVFVVIQLM